MTTYDSSSLSDHKSWSMRTHRIPVHLKSWIPNISPNRAGFSIFLKDCQLPHVTSPMHEDDRPCISGPGPYRRAEAGGSSGQGGSSAGMIGR